MLFTISLALAAGDHLAAEPDALLAWASISVLIPDALLFCGRRNIAATPAARLPFATETATNRSFDPASTHQRRMPGRQICRNPHGRRIKKREEEQKKGAPTCAGAPQRSGHCRVCAPNRSCGRDLVRSRPGRTYMLYARSVCSVMSRPSRSTSTVARRPTMTSTTLYRIAEPMPDHTSVVQTPQVCEVICAAKS